MNPDLKQSRIDLACALRWAARLNLHEGVDNHFSLAVPDDDGVMRGNRFLINPYGWHWSEVTASSLVLCNDKGEVLEGDNEVEDTAFFIHSRIHIGAPHAICVLHTHMPYATSITLLEEGKLEMIEQNALLFDGRIAYDDEYEGLALASDEGDRLARKILHPASDLYGAVPAEVRDGLNIPDGLFQLMAGSWNIKELLDDLTQAFK